MTAPVEIRNVCKSYGAHAVLKDVSFSIPAGGGFAIIGPNGAGKTTLFKVLTGEIAANSGTVLYQNQDITRVPAHIRVHMGIGRTFQVARVLPDSTAIENIVIAIEARLRADGARAGRWYDWRPARVVMDEAHQRLAEIGLENQRFVEARSLSHGDKKKLELALALALEPRVLMLDEPTAGMSPSERREAVALIKTLQAARGTTVLLTEHDMDVVFGLAQRLVVLNYGSVIAIGEPEDVRSNTMVSEIYLGKEMTGA